MDRRKGIKRRQQNIEVPVDGRKGEERRKVYRRSGGERRSGKDRRAEE